MTKPSTMPGTVSNAILLLWVSLALSAIPFVIALSSYFSFSAIIRFAIPAALFAFAIILLPTRNNLARLAILVVTAWNLVNLILGLGGLFSLWGLISLASIVVAAYACYLLLQSDDWFGSLTTISL